MKKLVLFVVFFLAASAAAPAFAGGYHYRYHHRHYRHHNYSHRGGLDTGTALGILGGIVVYKVVEGLVISSTVDKAVDAAERVRLEEIRARVVTRTMGKEGSVLYDSPNGSTSLRASHDPGFSRSTTTVVERRTKLPSCPTWLLEQNAVGYSSRERLFEYKPGAYCHYGGS